MREYSLNANLDNPIFKDLCIDYSSNTKPIFKDPLAVIQRAIVVNIGEVVNGDQNRDCHIITLQANIPQHMALLIFQQVVHRYRCVYCDGVLIAKHGS
ncbi:MAG: hypothetical protein ACRCXZ_00440 [Patescibacteria group bacterium]